MRLPWLLSMGALPATINFSFFRVDYLFDLDEVFQISSQRMQ